MSAPIVPFPCGRMAGKVRRLASMTYDGTSLNPPPGRSYAHAKAYERRMKADLRKSMERIGMDAATIDLELLAFTHAVVDEIRRLCRQGAQPEKATERNGDGHVTHCDGGDAA